MGHRRLFVLSLGLAHLLLIATAHAGGGHARGAATDDAVAHQGMSMVGSRPPSCAGRCWWCGARRCEAVQVPITPQQQDKSRRHGKSGGGGGGSIPSSTRDGGRGGASSSYDDRSNYKPLSWRCRCGGG
ncbi:EPIDERMAL PATTERNING FACTOR-like protein 2 [Zea mays]|uniref:Epidermal patterning factor-like protein n=1 Tax=Zea mays TaxID=4577 RepID=A0A1D6KGV0_MAIZE|nr:EPIDERMAL PATTERNING FACTOR-like protein 2 [Zea mays]